MHRQEMPFNSDSLLAELGSLPHASCYWVGYSGGADSSALLYALAQLRPRLRSKICAVHINHGLHRDAEAWEQHCAASCAHLDVALHSLRISVPRTTGEGLEAAARQHRYQAIEALLGDGDVFLTGHHREDQAETVLLNLLRSSGVDGLAGMPRTRPLGPGLLARPLLAFPLRSLRAYLEAEGIQWIQDPSNEETSHDRNFLRHRMMPLLESRWPDASGRLARSAQYCRQAAIALERASRARIEQLNPHPQVLKLPEPLDGDLDLGLLVRQWLKINRVPPLPAARLAELLRQLRQAAPDSQIGTRMPPWQLRLFDGCLWLHRRDAPSAPREPRPWSGQDPLELGQPCGRLELSGARRWPDGALELRFRTGGEQLELGTPRKHRKLKDVLREQGIPPWLRSQIPLLFSDGKLVAAADISLDVDLRNWLTDQQATLRWTPSDPLLAFARERALGRAVDPAQTLG
jgi:tRNA(Ile)-lysidine synthase